MMIEHNSVFICLFIILSSCSSGGGNDKDEEVIHGYSLIFKNGPVVIYPIPLTSRMIVTDSDENVLPIHLRSEFKKRIVDKCATHIFRVNGLKVRHFLLNEKRRAHIISVGKFSPLGEQERDKFLSQIKTEVLNRESICATA